MRIQRKAAQTFLSQHQPMIAQQKMAGELMDRFDSYAREIGCTTVQDEIMCHNVEQARLLAAWWTNICNPEVPDVLEGYASLIGKVRGVRQELLAKRVPCKLGVRVTVAGRSQYRLMKPLSLGPALHTAFDGKLAFFDHETGGHWRFAFDLSNSSTIRQDDTTVAS